MKTWNDFREAALYDPILYAAAHMADEQLCTREEALIFAALTLSKQVKELIDQDIARRERMPSVTMKQCRNRHCNALIPAALLACPVCSMCQHG